MNRSGGSDKPSRRRSLVQSASRKLSAITQPRSKKEHVSDSEGNKQDLKISPPFNFRDLSNHSSSSSNSDAIPSNTSSTKQQKQIRERYCKSPLDKPLPSLPVATITSGSPVKVRRSLIDAQERPLRRSLSPQSQVFEDWPALSPQKQTSDQRTKVATVIKPSMGESLAERIKKLNLNDNIEPDHSSSVRSDHASSPTSPSSPAPLQTRSKRSLPTSKQLTPQVRQNRTSELRLRLSASNMEESKKKSNLPSPLTNTSGNAAPRARPLKRPLETPRGRAAAARSRSRSRHRVTAEGSPYALPDQESKTSSSELGRKASLVLDSSKVDLNFVGHRKAVGVNADAENNTGQRSLQNDRRSSIPVAKKRVSDKSDAQDDFKKRVDASSVKSPPNNSKVRGYIATESELNTHTDSSSTTPTVSFDSQSQTKFDDTAAESLADDSKPLLSATGNADAPVAMSDGSKEVDGFLVRSLSKSMLSDGPILRISPDADEILRGTGTCMEDTDADEDVSQQINFQHLEQDTASGTLASTHDQADSKTATSAPHLSGQVKQTRNERRSVSESYSIPRKPVNSSNIIHKQSILHATTTSAPPIKPGKPEDQSSNLAWPFKESAIAPFKTSTTPERWYETNSAFVRTNKASPNSVQPESSPAQSEVSKYTVGEALIGIKPLRRAGTQRSMLANSNGDMHETVVSSSVLTALPARSSSRVTSSGRTTGLRTPSTRMPQLKFHEPPTIPSPSITPLPSVRRPRYMKSFTRSSQNLATAAALTPQIHKKEKPLPSPIPTTSSVASGKGVIKNIRNLFHKRAHLHEIQHGSLHRQAESSILAESGVKPLFSPVVTSPLLSSQLPRSPQVKNTSSPRTRSDAKKPIKGHFSTNRVVRPFASSSPAPTELNSSPPSVTNQHHIHYPKPKLINTSTTTPKHSEPQLKSQFPTPNLPAPTSPTLEPHEFRSATNLVYHILDLVQNDNTTNNPQTKKLFLELTQSIVTTLSLARDVEKSLEQARQVVARCEVRAIEVRMEIKKVEDVVGRVLHSVGAQPTSTGSGDGVGEKEDEQRGYDDDVVGHVCQNVNDEDEEEGDTLKSGHGNDQEDGQ